ncbi:DNA translocase FtsK [Rhizobium esperanzae]|uniref:S-DNA-T family DNA segregation ATPase FtsK/SpoIIIE n=1 Tax=Rhizobium esperanzae TaxID=1967781 RepID=A0A7W6W487_9HYPH|nr:DNA translocase FtsK [Rhizobium esperanzae]MBB4235332.1 S-DNA-T family DNA segregation ATPase FtsK/SpoIIIE [Rhizobium esperanzae]
MRFPRTNLTDAGDFSSGIETELPDETPREKPAAPIWQSNFSLAPNVRFTRTPETLISRRREPNEPVRDDSQLGQQAIRIEPVAVDVPFDIYLPEPDEIPAAPDMVELQPPPLAEEAVVPAFRATAELSSISDFAFWEVMAFEEAEPVRAPSLISLPKAEAAPESITSLFRIMEWRPGRPAPAPVASRSAPPPAVSAKVAIRPPVAPSLEKPRRVPVEAPVAPAPQAIQVPPIAPTPQIVPAPELSPPPQRTPPVAAVLPSPRLVARPERIDASGYEFPPRALLQEPPERLGEIMSQETLEQNAGLLESVLEDFGIKGEIIHVRPGPVVTLYEFEPAPGVKSSRVIGLADDIARSMSALSARVAVVPGRNVIGIELPNVTRETVYFREMIESQDFEKSGYKLALGLGKTIGGEPVIAELAKMPHLLVAGTTGSGKSVAINTMILSLLYRMTPEQCRLIMVDPKMLELSVYDGIPHLLTPVVTDPKKAVMALKWAVREMEERYRKMSRLGVRNIDGYNGRVGEARDKGETIHIMVQVGFDRQTGAPIEESQELDLAPMPYIVVIVDEMADLMMVAGKEIEGAIQRLAQMARAAGIHLIMATQRPSVDVITGTIKANFPTRISFQVTSKIDSRTILGEQGAEQLLGQGDMLHMQGGGRISRVHGPFVSDLEVEKVVAHLKTQGRPEYLDTVTADEEEEAEEEEAGAVFDKSAMASEDGNELYEQAVKVVMRDKKCSTSYIQRRLGIGYNRAASLVERMEKEGLVGPANHVGKREIVSGRGDGD